MAYKPTGGIEMLRNSATLLTVLAVLTLVSGCSDSDPTVTPTGDLAADMVDVALDSDLATEELVTAELDAMDALAPATTGEGDPGAVTDERSFSRSRPCPGGGTMTVEGRIVRTFDPATGVMEAEATGSRTRTDCVFDRGDRSVTVNATAAWEQFRRRVDGDPDGPQTSHYSGSWSAVRSDGEERSWEFDYTVVRDPESQTRTIDGTTCGGPLHRRMGWHPHG
jgi:hypothetical protein